jgi:serralysin
MGDQQSSSGKPSLSAAQAGAQITRDHLSWAGAGPSQAVVLTYSFMGAAPGALPEDAGGFQPFNAAQIRAAELALQAWSDVADIHLERVGGPVGSAAYSNDGAIRFAGYTTGVAGAAAFTYMPEARPDASAASLQGDGWYRSSASAIAAPAMFQSGQMVFTHEIGHALGLDHPGEYNAVGTAPITYAANAAYAEDSNQYTIMSYFSERSTGANFGGAAPATPMLHDIAAIQSLYGANTKAFLGDTVYGFNGTTDRPWFNAASAASPLVFSVWDAGGTDTFDFSGYGQNQLIDLNAGQFSNVGGLTGNVSIALGAVIENAVGGGGADTVVGNASANDLLGMDGDDSIAAGDGDDTVGGNAGADTLSGGQGADMLFGGKGADLLVGGAGDDAMLSGNIGDDTVSGDEGQDTLYGGRDNDSLSGGAGADALSGDVGDDTLSGGAGADRFIFQAGSGGDLVTDFDGAAGDRIQLDAGAQFVVSGEGGGARIDLASGDFVVLAGVSPAGLDAWIVYA